MHLFDILLKFRFWFKWLTILFSTIFQQQLEAILPAKPVLKYLSRKASNSSYCFWS